MKLVKKFQDRIKHGGIHSGLSGALGYLYTYHVREWLLKQDLLIRPSIQTYNSIEVPTKKCIFDPYFPCFINDENPRYEDAEVNALREYCNVGDSVVIVGGGLGVTTVIAGNLIGEDGEVHTYEAQEDRYEQIRRTTEHNELSNRVTIHHSFVGENRGDEVAADTVITVPDQIPTCEYLELDCEGSEGYIIEHMNIKPRTISAEIHKSEVSYNEIRDALSRKGYEVEQYLEKDNSLSHMIATRK